MNGQICWVPYPFLLTIQFHKEQSNDADKNTTIYLVPIPNTDGQILQYTQKKAIAHVLSPVIYPW